MDKWLSIIIIIVMIFVSSSWWKRRCLDGNVTWYASQREQLTLCSQRPNVVLRKPANSIPCLWPKRCVQNSFPTRQLLPFFLYPPDSLKGFLMLVPWNKNICKHSTVYVNKLAIAFTWCANFCVDRYWVLRYRALNSTSPTPRSFPHMTEQDNYLLFIWRGTNDFDAEKSISRAIGKGWAQKSTLFWALK